MSDIKIPAEIEHANGLYKETLYKLVQVMNADNIDFEKTNTSIDGKTVYIGIEDEKAALKEV